MVFDSHSIDCKADEDLWDSQLVLESQEITFY
jgi:hypothetical protein